MWLEIWGCWKQKVIHYTNIYSNYYYNQDPWKFHGAKRKKKSAEIYNNIFRFWDPWILKEITLKNQNKLSYTFVGLEGLSTLEGNLMPNAIYTYTLNIWFSNE